MQPRRVREVRRERRALRVGAVAHVAQPLAHVDRLARRVLRDRRRRHRARRGRAQHAERYDQRGRRRGGDPCVHLRSPLRCVSDPFGPCAPPPCSGRAHLSRSRRAAMLPAGPPSRQR